LGLNIASSEGLPKLDENQKAPKDLMKWYPQMRESNGFAQVYPVRGP
jgi:hypothetical protein